MTDSPFLAQLRAHFSTTQWPSIEAAERTATACTLELFIAADMHWLTGHFPQQPVVAGVVQTHWASEIAKFIFAPGDEFVRIDNLKFQQVILPEQQLQLTLDYAIAYTPTPTSAIKFCYRQGETIFSEGKLTFNRAAHP